MRGQVGRGAVRWWAIAVLVGLVAACAGDDADDAGAGDDGASSAAPSPVVEEGPADTSDFDDVIRVTPHLEEGAAVQETIGFDGGAMSVEAADGTVFTLDVPADSVRMPVRITMTPVASIEGLPFGDGPSWAVDLQPSGLIFDVPARLTVSPPTPLEVAEQLPFTYQDDAVILARPVMDSSDVEIEVDHFSGYGVAKGLLGDVEEVRHRLGEDALQRISSEIRAVLLEQRQQELAGEEITTESLERLQDLWHQFEREVLEPRMAAADESCAAGRLAAETYFDWTRTVALLGIESSVDMDYRPVVDTMTRECMDEEHEMCVEQHVVHRLSPLYAASARWAALTGAPTEEVLARARQQVVDCLRFEVEVELTAVGQSDWGVVDVRSEDTASFSAELVFDPDWGRFEPVTVTMRSEQPAYDVLAGGCVAGTPDPWTAPAEVLGMGWTPTDHDPNEELGELESILLGLDLPEVALHIPSISCGGHDSGAYDDPVSSAAIFRVAHPEQFITEWRILYDDVFAIAEWDVEVPTGGPGTMRSSGYAELRHDPR